MRPIIGITSYVERARWGPWDAPAVLVPLTYVRAVEAAGGRAVLVPPSEDGVEEILASVDGLIFSGGADIDPQIYRADRHPETTGTRPDRDRAETKLLAAALERSLPVLAICRGMQLLNVVKGGDLVQHLPDLSADNAHRLALGEFSRHDVTIEPDTKLSALLGDRSMVASHHHQAPRRIGRDLRIAARAQDGTVEALEDPGSDFVMAVLWHPEEGEDRALFEALVERAARHKEHR